MYAITGVNYPDHQDKVMAYAEGSCVVGMTCSPIIGSMLYSYGGFELPFYFFGTMFLTAALCLKTLVSDVVDNDFQKVNELESDSPSFDDEQQMAESKPLTLMTIYTTAKIIFPLLLGSFNFFTWCELEPILALRLKNFDLTSA